VVGGVQSPSLRSSQSKSLISANELSSLNKYDSQFLVAYLLSRGIGKMPKTKVNIQKLKNFAFTQLPKGWVLREILLAETEELEVFTFMARLSVWLKLSRLERGDFR